MGISIWYHNGCYQFIYYKEIVFIKNDTGSESSFKEVKSKHKPLSTKEKKTLLYLFITISLWITESLHGFDIAFITIAMSVVMMAPNIGVISWKQGLKSISWSLIFFVAGATALGELLVSYKVIEYIQKNLYGYLSQFENINELVVLLIIVIITVTSHICNKSHYTSRRFCSVIFII